MERLYIDVIDVILDLSAASVGLWASYYVLCDMTNSLLCFVTAKINFCCIERRSSSNSDNLVSLKS